MGEFNSNGVTSMYDNMNLHQKAALSVCVTEYRKLCPALYHNPLPHTVSRLMLWQSSGICLQISCLWDREVNSSSSYVMSFIGFSCVMKCINVTGLWNNSAGIEHYYIVKDSSCLKLCDIYFGEIDALCKQHKRAQGKLNPIIWDLFILPSVSLGFSSDMLIWLRPSVLSRRTLLQCLLRLFWSRKEVLP